MAQHASQRGLQTSINKLLPKSLKIDPNLIDPSEIEILEDLVVAAHNDAKTKLEQMIQEKTSEMMGGMQLPPGIKLPF